MIHLLIHPGVRIDDMRTAVFKRPLLSLPEGEELLLPVCPAEERASVQVIAKGEHVRRFEPLARGRDNLPLCYAPTAGTVDGCVLREIPSRGKMACVRLLPNGEESAPHPLSRPSRTKVIPQKVLRAAGLLRLNDEVDGAPLEAKLEHYCNEKIDLLVCDALCDDPFCADGLCTLTEMTEEVCDGLRLAAQACGCSQTLIAVFRAQAAGFHTVQRLQGGLGDCELLNVDGRYPLWPALQKMPRFAGQKLGRIGAQACMIVDFHTHAFPQKIAAGAIAALEASSKVPAYRDGTAESLVASMRSAGIDRSVLLPIATKPTQVTSVNRFAAECSGTNGIVSFGSVHPDCENWRKILRGIRSMETIEREDLYK